MKERRAVNGRRLDYPIIGEIVVSGSSPAELMPEDAWSKLVGSP